MVLGIDAGSTHVKLVWLEGGQVVDRFMAPTQPQLDRQIEAEVKIKGRVDRVVATGYGRHLLVKRGLAHKAITEIKAQAMGVTRTLPRVGTILDLGGQDFKVIRVKGEEVVDFLMNDRCAAGTGRFLEMAAGRLGVAVKEMEKLAARAKEGTALNSMCAVFAESELVSLMAQGESPARIARGILESIAQRLASTVKRAGAPPPMVLTGGGGLLPLLKSLLEERLETPLLVPPRPLFTAALGAALEAEKAGSLQRSRFNVQSYNAQS